MASVIRATAGVLVLLALVAGCVTVESSYDEDSETDTSTTSTTSTPSTTSAPLESTDPLETIDPLETPLGADEMLDGFETMGGDEAVDAPAATAKPLPGDPIFGPAMGALLAVVGVDHDDVLNVRDIPNGEIIATLENEIDRDSDDQVDDRVIVREIPSNEIVAVLDVAGIVAAGHTRALPTTIWHEVRAGSVVGWASGAYLSPLGVTVDVTPRVVELIGETPAAETLDDLGQMIADLFGSDGEVQSRIAVSAEPVVIRGFSEFAIDVVGLPDDSLRGYRLYITVHVAQNNGYGTGPYTIQSVSAATLCYSERGVTEGGLCR